MAYGRIGISSLTTWMSRRELETTNDDPSENVLTDEMIEEWKRDFESTPLFEQHMASARAAIEREKKRMREAIVEADIN